MALIAPPAHTGIIGASTAAALHALFGHAAGWFPLLVALLATIVFLEINVPRMIANLGGAACAYFLLVDTMFARNGGWVGSWLDVMLRTLVGDVGAIVVLAVAALGLTVWITNVSLKKVIGWTIARLAALRPERTERPAAPEPEALPGPRSLREAFHLPALLPRSAPAAAAAVAVAAPAAAAVVAAPPSAPAVPERVVYDADDEDEDEEEIDDDDLDDDEYDEDEDDDDEDDDEDRRRR